MSVEEELKARAGGKCELCAGEAHLQIHEVGPDGAGKGAGATASVYICTPCQEQIDNPANINSDHWKALNETMWSEVPAVQVMAWRLLDRMKDETWAADLLDMLYLDEDNLAWAQAGQLAANDGSAVQHVDCNGAPLAAGDTVTLIKDLNVKGASFTAKRGTSVRRISLVADNPEQIEGRVNDQRIVILTKFVKKSG